jgi:hypothetical protein
MRDEAFTERLGSRQAGRILAMPDATGHDGMMRASNSVEAIIGRKPGSIYMQTCQDQSGQPECLEGLSCQRQSSFPVEQTFCPDGLGRCFLDNDRWAGEPSP